MIFVASLILILVAGLGLAYLMRQGASGFSRRRRTFRAALVIATIRLAILWSGVLWWRDASGWRQIAAYLLLVVNCLVEMGVVRSWRNDFAVWVALLSVLVAATSLGLGYAWTLTAEHFSSRTR